MAQDLPGLCLGYDGPPPAVARWARRKYVGRWFLTDDIVSLDDDGNLRFIAKADDTLPCEEAGFLPDDVERVLAAHRMVAAAAVLAITGKDGKTQVVAAVVAKDGLPRGDAVAEVLLAADILAEAAKSLTPYALPKRIVFVDGIPPHRRRPRPPRRVFQGTASRAIAFLEPHRRPTVRTQNRPQPPQADRDHPQRPDGRPSDSPDLGIQPLATRPFPRPRGTGGQTARVPNPDHPCIHIGHPMSWSGHRGNRTGGRPTPRLRPH